MNRHLIHATVPAALLGAFSAGALAIGWVAAGYLRSHPFGLGMTLLIGAFYGAGALELRRFARATMALQRALAAPPAPGTDLALWLAPLPAALRQAVRQRIEGERLALPGPAMAATLVGLLVLLGMLGTFLGMVATLNGTGLALERATDLQTMRDSLAAPVKGLGLAFGTSVAGVAASAMLGLMAALCRQQRQHAAQQLQACIDGPLHGFTRAHRQAREREASFGLQQQQAGLMPALVDQLQALMQRLEAQARQSDERLLAGQERFHAEAGSSYRALAAAVDQSLRLSLAESARITAASIEPVVQATMAGLTREAAALHSRLGDTVQQQLEGLSARLEASTRRLAADWTTTLDTRLDSAARQLDGVVQQASAHWQRVQQEQVQLQARLQEEQAQVSARLQQEQAQSLTRLQTEQAQSLTRLQGDAASRDAQRMAAWSDALAGLAATLQQQWQQAGEQALAQQAQICRTLEQTASRISTSTEAQARSTIGEIARLAHTAAEAPRAAAELVAQLREALSDSLARDTGMLEERSRIMATLNGLLAAVQHTATDQKAAIDSLVAGSAAWLEQAGTRFHAQLEAESARMVQLAAQLGGSAVEVASLGEAFGAGVAQFSQTSDKLVAHLARIDDTLAQTLTRSDDQLAYYVAQARELIDLCLVSQKQIVDDLQRMATRRAALPSEA